MERIQIKEDDFLWRFYCKRFSIASLDVKDPKNLCRYFWTAVLGLGMWWHQEVSLREKYWWLFFGAVTIFFACGFLLHFDEKSTAFLITLPLFCYSLLLVFETVRKAIQWTDRLPAKIQIPLIFLFLVALISTIWWFDRPAFDRLLSILWECTKWFSLLLTIVAIATFSAALIKEFSSDGGAKLVRLWKNCITYLSAKKQGVCPFVVPPEGFASKDNK